MAKQAIILADTDEKFIASLELKFVEELNDDLNLEIITDENYFNEFFSQPQNAIVLVVSEDLYTSELKRHNINKIFVLTESVDDNGTEDLEIEKIFKYSSPKEIYKHIVAQSNINSGVKAEKETIVAMFYSASGGVGKSTLALGVSDALVKSFNKVLYINAQRINSFQYMLNNQSPIPNSAISEFMDVSGNLYGRIKHIFRNERFDYLPPFSMALSSIGLEYSTYIEIIKSAKASKNYDVIIVDTDVTFDKEKADLITLADKVFIITEQTRKSVFATNTILKNISCNDSSKYFFICNKFDDQINNYLSSNEFEQRFIINEYIKYDSNVDSLTLSEIGSNPEIQKISYLIV